MATINKKGNLEYKPEELTPPESVDYFIYRTDLEREHRHATWWRNFCICVLAVLAICVVWFFWRESQYEDIVITQEASTEGGGNAILNGTADGDISYYGYSEADDQGT